MKHAIVPLFCLLMLSKIGRSFTPRFKPVNPRQEELIRLIRSRDTPIIVAVGSPGTGKSLLACQEALHHLHQKKIRKMVLTRPTITVDGEELGYLPGSLETKMSPWIRPLFDCLQDSDERSRVQKLVREGVIEICPLAFMRGRTFRDSFIILDEAQNTTPLQMKMALTRIGPESKMIITGDLGQSDLGNQNGLRDFVDRLSATEPMIDGVGMVRFSDQDILRHPVIEKILALYRQ